MTVLLGALVCKPARAADDSETFDIWEYRVLGNTVLAPAQIEAAVYPQLGPARTLADVEEARRRVEAAYRDQGFGAVYVDVPEQDVEAGVVRLKVTEGRLGRVRVTGARYFANGQIRDALPALESGEVLTLKDLQQQLGAVNRQSADRKVTPVLRAGAQAGTVDVELKVNDELPVHTSVEVNDRYTANTSKTRLNFNLSYDNLFQRFQRLSFQYQTAPEEPQESRVIAATYIAPLPGTSNLLALYAVDTNSDFATLGSLGSLSVLGTGRIYGARFIAVLLEGDGLFHNVALGADYKDFTDNVVLPDGTRDQTPIEYVNWTAAYDATLRTPNTSTSFNVAFNFGVAHLANAPEEFGFKRFKAEPNYAYLSAEVKHERPLLWGLGASVRASGQFATEPLISNEQFAAGGMDSVRGYLEAEALGDMGASGSIELRSPPLTSWLPGAHLEQLHFFTFFDAAVLGVIEPLPVNGEKVSRLNLSSYGVGMRLSGFGGFNAALHWAYPLRSSTNVEEGDSRIHFSVRYGL